MRIEDIKDGRTCIIRSRCDEQVIDGIPCYQVICGSEISYFPAHADSECPKGLLGYFSVAFVSNIDAVEISFGSVKDNQFTTIGQLF